MYLWMAKRLVFKTEPWWRWVLATVIHFTIVKSTYKIFNDNYWYHWVSYNLSSGVSLNLKIWPRKGNGRTEYIFSFYCLYSTIRAIFAWPWTENAQTKQKQQKNGNRGIWLVYQTDTNARGFWLVKQMLEWKNFIAENFLEINRITSLWHHTATRCNTIG